MGRGWGGGTVYQTRNLLLIFSSACHAEVNLFPNFTLLLSNATEMDILTLERI